MRSQLADQCLSGRLRNITGHAALVAVGAQVVGGFLGVVALRVFQKRWAPGAGVVAGFRPFYFDDISAQISQSLGAPGASQHAGEIKDANAA